MRSPFIATATAMNIQELVKLYEEHRRWLRTDPFIQTNKPSVEQRRKVGVVSHEPTKLPQIGRRLSRSDVTCTAKQSWEQTRVSELAGTQLDEQTNRTDD